MNENDWKVVFCRKKEKKRYITDISEHNSHKKKDNKG